MNGRCCTPRAAVATRSHTTATTMHAHDLLLYEKDLGYLHAAPHRPRAPCACSILLRVMGT